MSNPEPDLQALEVPEGITRAAFRGTMLAYASVSARLGRAATAKETYDEWPRVPQKTMAMFWSSPEFEAAALVLGAPVDKLGGLTQEQMLVLAALAEGGSNIPHTLKRLGIPFQRFVNWRKQALFRTRYEEMTSGAWYERLGEVRMAITQKAVDGNMDAAKLVLAKTGEYDPAAQAVEDARLIVIKTVESVMRHVVDMKAREAIMQDLRDFGLEQQAARVHATGPATLTP